jgi:hypothetical protein
MFAACAATKEEDQWKTLYLLAGLAHPACGGSDAQMRTVLDEFSMVNEKIPEAWKTCIPPMRDIFDIAVARHPKDAAAADDDDELPREPEPEPHDPKSVTYTALILHPMTSAHDDIPEEIHIDVHSHWTHLSDSSKSDISPMSTSMVSSS